MTLSVSMKAGLILGASIGALGGTPASAQSPPTANSATAAPDSRQIDEIIVTAQRRSERLQDVPIATT